MRFSLGAIFLVTAIASTVQADRGLQCTKDGDGRWLVKLDERPMLRFTVPAVRGAKAPSVRCTPFANGTDEWFSCELVWNIAARTQQDEVAVRFEFLDAPDFHWMPHLAPEEGFVVGQHVFRSPAIITARDQTALAIVPDLALVGQLPGNPWFLDLDAPRQQAALGLSLTETPVHVGFRKIPGMVLEPGAVTLRFFVTAYKEDAQPINPWRRTAQFLWERYARPLVAAGEPSRVPLDTYVKHTYDWAFDSWAHAVWQEFDLNGTHVGAPQFIVNASQSPNYPGPWFQREFLSIWNQAWFSSLRSASGVARWARRTSNSELQRKAELTKAFALAAPVRDGIFPSVFRTDNQTVTVDGQQVDRPKPWSEGYWTNSNRCPHNFGVTPDWYHVLDASWTCLLMLRWHTDIAADEKLVQYATTYADRLMTLQDAQGFFPGWLHPQTQKPAEVMSQTPETALSVTFLLKLAEITGDKRYRTAALRAIDALLVEAVPTGRWEDFETYWSCCGFGQQDHVGRKFARNNMYKQNNFCIFWTAESLLAAYQATHDEKYLRWGRRTLDELSMCQQVWQPPFIYVPALGGFGVMNFDGEWNDSRESLFAELYLDYYRVTGDAQLFERGIAALQSAFIMMYCPENPQQKQQWEKAHKFFGPQDYGFTMENYGHGGPTSPEGGGIGEFTIYDWGNGAASEARNRIFDHYGDVYIDRVRKAAFGIDSIAVSQSDTQLVLQDRAGVRREIKVVFEDGTNRAIVLDGQLTLARDGTDLKPQAEKDATSATPRPTNTKIPAWDMPARVVYSKAFPGFMDIEIYQEGGRYYVRDKIKAADYRDPRPRRAYYVDMEHIGPSLEKGYPLPERGGIYQVQCKRWREGKDMWDLQDAETAMQWVIKPGPLGVAGELDIPPQFVIDTEDWRDQQQKAIPPFEPIKGKVSPSYRYNADQTWEDILSRGASHTSMAEGPGGVEKTLRTQGDPLDAMGEQGFAALSRAELTRYASEVPPFAFYLTDWEKQAGWHNTPTYWSIDLPNEKVLQNYYFFFSEMNRLQPARRNGDYYRALKWNNSFYEEGEAYPLRPRFLEQAEDPEKFTAPAFRPFTYTDGTTRTMREVCRVYTIDWYLKSNIFPERRRTAIYQIYCNLFDTINAKRITPADGTILGFAWFGTDNDLPYRQYIRMDGGWLGYYNRIVPAPWWVMNATYISHLFGDGFHWWHDAGPEGHDRTRRPPDYGMGPYHWEPDAGGPAEPPLVFGGITEKGPLYPREPRYNLCYTKLAEYRLKQYENFLTQRRSVVDYSLDEGQTWVRQVGNECRDILEKAEKKQPLCFKWDAGNDLVLVFLTWPFADSPEWNVRLRIAPGQERDVRMHRQWPMLRVFSKSDPQYGLE